MSTPPAAAPIAVLAIHHQPVPAALPAVPTPVTMTSSFIVAASTPATLSYTNSAPASFSPSSLSSTSLSGSKASPPAVACLPPTAAVMNGSTVGGTGSTNGTTTSGGGSTSGKDSGWLTLEVCREHVRQRCTRSDNECRFAHPPPHVDIQNGRVVCCFDSIKGRCQRTEPPCKYLHPPQHLKEQLLQNGRHNLIMKNLQQISRIHQHTAAGANGAATTVLPTATAFIPVVNPYLLVNQSNCYASYYNGNSVPPTAIVTPTSGSNGCIVPGVATPSASVAPPADQSVQEVEPGSSGAVDGCTYSTVQTTTGGNQPPGTQQYWTLSPSGGTVYTTNPLAAPYYSHCSPVYYQNGSYAIPATAGPAGTTMLLAKRTPMAGGSAGVPVTANGLIEGCGGSKNGYLPSAAAAVYGPCSTAAYQQMALSTGPIDLPSCYPMAITVPPPISGFYGC